MARGDLTTYRGKRHFDRTPEPGADDRRPAAAPGWSFVIHKHDARSLHYDLRLELDGVLKSWAVPKGISYDPRQRHLAIHVEDHPLAYGDFEGVIPAGEYGGGTVMVWDRGTWEPDGDPHRGLAKGKFTFTFHGQKLRGGWTLTRMGGKANEGDKDNWLLIKRRDDEADAERDVDEQEPRSVLSGRTMAEIARAADRVWSSEAPRIDAGTLPGARQRALPRALRPQLATRVDHTPTGDGWLHEIKYDGYRLLVFVQDGEARLVTRGGKDWTDRFPSLAAAAARLPVSSALLDGEACVVDAHGRTDFQALQNRLGTANTDDVALLLFDLVHLDGYDLTQVPLSARKTALRRLLVAAGVISVGDGDRSPTDRISSAVSESPLRFSDHIAGSGPDVYALACRLDLEGVVSKKADSVYESRRSRSWVKTKCQHRQEFVIGGWLPSDKRTGLRSLLLGTHGENGDLVYAGKVGTGFTDTSLRDLARRLRPLALDASPFVDAESIHEHKARWVRPELVCEVEFSEWTSEGRLRHPSFKGLREDKSPNQVVREDPRTAGAAASGPRGGKTPRRAEIDDLEVRITHPDRVLFPDAGLTKGDLARYYADVSDLLLPHVANRPLTLVRCPAGRHKACFYQKHHAGHLPQAVGGVAVAEREQERMYLTIDDREGLLSLIQMGAIELHPWSARNDRLDRPDLMVFDLDPGPGVPVRRIADAALRIRDRLADLDLVSFAKTSGGKGYHVVVPLVRRAEWDEVRAFSHAVARELARDTPREIVTVATKSKREGRVFVDYLRNSRGATSVAALSTRAREGAPVSMPVSWEEVAEAVAPDAFTLNIIGERLAGWRRNTRLDPWREYFSVRQSITVAARRAVGV